MKTLGSILWHFPFFGFITSFFTFLIGLLFISTVIGAPIGLGLIQHAKFLLSPFSKRMMPDSTFKKDTKASTKIIRLIVFLIYFPLGVLISMIVVVQIMLLFITIIGIPMAVILAKSLSTYFNPIGKICVDSVVAEEFEKRKAKEKLDTLLQ